MNTRAIPQNPNAKAADKGTAWSAPTLADFTSQPWEQLSDAEKRRIAGHFLYAEQMPPQSFGALHLPHHRASDGAVVFRGVAAATGRLNQTSMPTDQMAAAKAHLRAHYRQLDEPAPESLRAAPGELEITDLGPLALRADLQPSTLDAAARTVEVIFSTGAAVPRMDFFSGQRYLETLSLAPGHVRLDRLNAGAPFLNAHSSFTLGNVLGVIVPGTARVAKGEATATVQFSRRPEVDGVWQDVRDGILRNVSVGYRVHKYERIPAAEDGGLETRKAVDWEPFEVSAVPMPADTGAQIRGDHAAANHCLIVPGGTEERGKAMGDETTKPTSTDPQLGDPVPPLPLPEPHRTAPEPAPTERDAGADQERARIQGILHACEAARLPLSIAQQLITDKVSLVDAQTRVLETLRTRVGGHQGNPEAPSGVRITGADPLENVWRGIGNAILHKAAPQYFKLEDIGRPYRSRSLLAAAELCLHHRGVKTAELSKMELAALAFGLQTRAGYHTTSDFANILADVANKTLRAAYGEAPQTFAPIARRIPVPDFKPINRMQIGDAPALLQVLEHGEFKRGTIADGKEVFTLGTWGRIFAITRKALVNDDLDAFGRLTVMFGRAARNKESDLVWAEITNNAAMGDTELLFSTAHANQSSVGAAIDVTTLGAGRAAMRAQKGLDGTTPLNLTPRYLIVPVAKETVADQYTTLITPAQGSAVNPFSGRLEVIAEPRLDSNSAYAWYLAASTDQVDIIEYGFLDGEDGPVVETRVGFDVDGLEVKWRHDVAAKVIDYRGLYKNAGTT